MRRAAGFQSMRIDAAPELYEQVKSIISAWTEDKFREVGGATIIRGSGRPAQRDIGEDGLADGRVRLRLHTVEEAGGGSSLQFETSTKVLFGEEGLFLRTEVLLGRGEAVLGAQHGTTRAPRFFAEILRLPGHWFFAEGADRLMGQVFRVRRGGLDLLEQVLANDARRLPIVLVSSVGGRERFEGLSASLARTTTGLAHVAILDEDASWELTDRFGERWSCYGQAVRVFWPHRFGVGSPYDHPLHLADRMPETCERAVDRIVQPLIEASSLLGGFSAIDRFERDLARASLDAEVAASREDRDYNRLEVLYAKANDDLRAENDQLRLEVEELKGRLEAATAIQAEPAALAEQVESLATVVADFQARRHDLLAFADDWSRQVDSINPDGFSPGELERCLDHLVDMARTLRETDGSLGKQTAIWCRERGQECSADSETDRNATAHEWRIAGRLESFSLHLKPTDRKAPDRCIRIYFKPMRNPWRVAVGYVGSKAGL